MSLAFSDEHLLVLMDLCRAVAEDAIRAGDVPIAALALDQGGSVLAAAHNTQNTSHDPSAHAEVNVLRLVSDQRGSRYLPGVRLLSNAETCSGCASFAIKAGIRHFYYGAPAEASMDPNLPLADLVRFAKEPVHIQGLIDAERCAEQIRRGRAALALLAGCA